MPAFCRTTENESPERASEGRERIRTSGVSMTIYDSGHPSGHSTGLAICEVHPVHALAPRTRNPVARRSQAYPKLHRDGPQGLPGANLAEPTNGGALGKTFLANDSIAYRNLGTPYQTGGCWKHASLSAHGTPYADAAVRAWGRLRSSYGLPRFPPRPP